MRFWEPGGPFHSKQFGRRPLAKENIKAQPLALSSQEKCLDFLRDGGEIHILKGIPLEAEGLPPGPDYVLSTSTPYVWIKKDVAEIERELFQETPDLTTAGSETAEADLAPEDDSDHDPLMGVYQNPSGTYHDAYEVSAESASDIEKMIYIDLCDTRWKSACS